MRNQLINPKTEINKIRLDNHKHSRITANEHVKSLDVILENYKLKSKQDIF